MKMIREALEVLGLKLNRLRSLALGLLFLAFIIMYLSSYSTLATASRFLLPIGLIMGTTILLASVAIYFRLGVISKRLPQVECPHCGRLTKMLAKKDGCMHCQQQLRPAVAEHGEHAAETTDPVH